MKTYFYSCTRCSHPLVLRKFVHEPRCPNCGIACAFVKESEITPEEQAETALRVAGDAYGRWLDHDSDLVNAVAKAIYDAVETEREDCARLADKWGKEGLGEVIRQRGTGA